MYLSPQQLRIIQDFFRTKPVRKVYLFGSYARGEATAESDIDLLAELDHTEPIGWNFFGWHEELATLLGNPVDLSTPQGLAPMYRPFIEADRTLIYERSDWRQTAA
ncbi:nucleotidyltransferase family protein [Hymenobacter sp. APR13]|uniref:nucleotidyltransferase family protein n=1 Tax=Hymenobacter sp. APR13 TaxID=1356852 RepID=UPI000900619B|nr:nucleotidyltransferase domain-containing protein [Hymenobacter sp. APR13]